MKNERDLMSEVRLIIREGERDWSGTVPGFADNRAIAALSADPVTLAELEAASGRYALPRSTRPCQRNANR